MPTALGSSSWVNITARDEITSGTMKPAASPSTVRAAMNAPAFGEYAHASEPRPNTARAPVIIFLRPNRSPSSPPGSSATASASVYAETNHCRSDADACKDTASVGSATLSTVASSATASTARDSPASAHHLRAPAVALASITVMTLTVSRDSLSIDFYFQLSSSNQVQASAKSPFPDDQPPPPGQREPARRPDVEGCAPAGAPPPGIRLCRSRARVAWLAARPMGLSTAA